MSPLERERDEFRKMLERLGLSVQALTTKKIVTKSNPDTLKEEWRIRVGRPGGKTVECIRERERDNNEDNLVEFESALCDILRHSRQEIELFFVDWDSHPNNLR